MFNDTLLKLYYAKDNGGTLVPNISKADFVILYPHSTAYPSLRREAGRANKVPLLARFILESAKQGKLLSPTNYKMDQDEPPAAKKVKREHTSDDERPSSLPPPSVSASISQSIPARLSKASARSDVGSVSAPVGRVALESSNIPHRKDVATKSARSAIAPPGDIFKVHLESYHDGPPSPHDPHSPTTTGTKQGRREGVGSGSEHDGPPSPQLPHSLRTNPPEKGTNYTYDEERFFREYAAILFSRNPDMSTNELSQKVASKVRSSFFCHYWIVLMTHIIL